MEESVWKPTKLYGKIHETNPPYYYFKKKRYYGDLLKLKQQQINISNINPRNNWFREVEDHIEIKIKDGTVFKIDTGQLERVKTKIWYCKRSLIFCRNGDNRIHLIDFITNSKEFQHGGDIFDFRKCNLEKKRTEEDLWTKDLIPNKEWKELCKEYRKYKGEERGDTIVADIISSVGEKYKEFQLPKYQNWEIYRDFYNLMIHPSDIIQSIPLGSKLTIRFMISNMMRATHVDSSKTIFDVWNDEKYKTRLIKAAITLDSSKLAFNSLYKTFGLAFYKVGNFSPLAARNIYNLLCPKGGRVLDFCSGYGGRLVGYYVSKNPIEYVGIDPNTDLVVPFQEIISWLRKYFPNKEKKIKMICSCAEDVNYKEYGKFDLIFTSPPYFNTEKYNTEETQSYIRYPGKEDWMNNFLLKVMEKMKDCLKEDGKIAINIKFRRKMKGMEKLFLEGCKNLGLKRKEDMSYGVSARPGAEKSGEPIYIFTL